MIAQVFPAGIDTDLLPVILSEETKGSNSSENNAFSSLCVNLTDLMQNVEISIPTLNGYFKVHETH